MSGLSRFMTPHDRFWMNVERASEGCWEWKGTRNDQGYGLIGINGTRPRAHRVAWEMSNGPIQASMEIDHRCHNRGCVNPEHLQAVTHKQNQENRTGAQENNTSCGIRGVTWDPKNKMWRARAGHNGKNYDGGRFRTLYEAEAAAIALRNSLHSNNLGDLGGVA